MENVAQSAQKPIKFDLKMDSKSTPKRLRRPSEMGVQKIIKIWSIFDRFWGPFSTPKSNQNVLHFFHDFWTLPKQDKWRFRGRKQLQNVTEFGYFSQVGDHAMLLLFTTLLNDFGPPESTNSWIKSTVVSDRDFRDDSLDFCCFWGAVSDLFSTLFCSRKLEHFFLNLSW